MHGVQPNANANPSRNPLQIPGCAAELRKCTSRFSQRASAGPKNPIIESERKCTAPSPANSGPWWISATTPSATRTAPRIIPDRGCSLASAPTKCNPNKMISAPAIGASVLRFSRKKEPTALAEAPNEIKTTEKPNTKETDDENRLAF